MDLKESIYQDNKYEFIESHKVDAVHTTGSGDCFIGALASSLLRRHDLSEAAIFANKAAAISVTKERCIGFYANYSRSLKVWINYSSTKKSITLSLNRELKASTSKSKATSELGFGLKICPMIDSLNSLTVCPSVNSPLVSIDT